MRKGFLGGLETLTWGLSLSLLASTIGWGMEHAVPKTQESPRRVIERFDSLLTVGSPDALREARTLTVGTARRLFPLLAETQAKVNLVLDTARSRDTVLEERVSNDARDQGRDQWAAVKLQADVYFTKPFLGMTEFSSVQIVHLHRATTASAWRIVDLEQVADESAATIPRSGALPTAVDLDGDTKILDATSGLLPVSSRAPAREDQARVTRLRLRVSWRDASQSPRVLETSLPRISDSLATGRAARWPDSLSLYLASTEDLDLTDKMLRTRAAKLKQGSSNDVETTRRIWQYVSTSFDYKLGATLFATSREALRDLKGDCSEAAVLTAALLRAAGIPSRVVFGYASLGQGVWIGHAWAEAWLGSESGGWIGVDAALREYPAGPNRVALVALSGQEDMKTAATNLMMSTLSNLDIEILAAWAGDESIPLVEHPAAAEEAGNFWKQVLEGMGD